MLRRYKYIGKKGSGTFSTVLKAQRIKDGKLVAIKRMKQAFKSMDEVNHFREIQALRRLGNHPNIVQLIEVIYDPTSGKLALVFELMQMNIYELIKRQKKYLPAEVARNYIYQMFKGLAYCHKRGVFHRDIKPENILINGDQLKIADLGSCRGMYSTPPFTEYISTRWYRSPECLITDGYYNFKMDVFAAGCVMFEILSLIPLFPGKDELDQINKIHAVLGTPSKELVARLRKGTKTNPISTDWIPQKGIGLRTLLPSAPPEAIDLMNKLLEYDPEKRIPMGQVLLHPYLRDLTARDEGKSLMRRTIAPPVLGSMGVGQSGDERIGMGVSGHGITAPALTNPEPERMGKDKIRVDRERSSEHGHGNHHSQTSSRAPASSVGQTLTSVPLSVPQPSLALMMPQSLGVSVPKQETRRVVIPNAKHRLPVRLPQGLRKTKSPPDSSNPSSVMSGGVTGTSSGPLVASVCGTGVSSQQQPQQQQVPSSGAPTSGLSLSLRGVGAKGGSKRQSRLTPPRQYPNIRRASDA